MPDEPKKTTETNSLEHPISELDAKKYAGQGDFNLPVSPLDQLTGTAPPTVQTAVDAAAAAVKPEEVKPVPVQPVTPLSPVMPGSKNQSPLDAVVDPSTAHPVSVMRPTKADTTVAPKAQPVPGGNLESQAKKLLKDLDSNSPPKKKKRRGRAATKMALAAVLVVMMGAGGVVGMNLLKMQQVGDSRSQASCTCTDGTRDYAIGKWGCVGTTTYRICEGSDHGCRWSDTVNTCPTTQTCQTDTTVPEGKCVASENNSGTCASPFFCVTKDSTQTCVAGGGATGIVDNEGRCCVLKDSLSCDGGKTCVSSCTSMGGEGSTSYCTADKCTNNGQAGCYVYSYHADKQDASKVWVTNCKTAMNENGVETLVCEGTSASLPPVDERCGAYQIDVVCGGSTVDNISDRTPDCEPDPSEPPGAVDCLCSKLNPDKAAPKLGETVTFTCSGSGPIDHFEFQYKVASGAYASLAATGDKAQLKVDKVGQYTVQCRVCKSATECTEWGVAQQ